MGIFFRKRFGTGPLNLNLSKSGIGLSLGVRGFRAGISSSGRHYVSAGLPGTGIYYRQLAKRKQGPRETAVSYPAPTGAITPKYPLVHAHTIGYGLGYVVGWLLILSPLALLVWFILRVAR